MYEYCSAEPRAVFEKIASYYGYAERRRNDTLRTPLKGYVNISVNEPELSTAARQAAQIAAVRHDPKRFLEVLQKRNKHYNVKIPAFVSDDPAASSSETTAGEKSAETDAEATLNEVFGYETRNSVLPALSLDDDSALEMPSACGMGVMNADFENALRHIETNGKSREEVRSKYRACIPDDNGKIHKDTVDGNPNYMGQDGERNISSHGCGGGKDAGDGDSNDRKNKVDISTRQ